MIPFLDSPWAWTEASMWCWCLPLYIPQTRQKQNNLYFNLNSYMNTEGQMCVWLNFFFKTAIWRITLGRKRIQAFQWRISKCKKKKKVSQCSFYDPHAFWDRSAGRLNGYLKQAYIPFVQPPSPRWQTSQFFFPHINDSIKEKIHFLYTECPANVCERKKKKIHPSTQPNTT